MNSSKCSRRSNAHPSRARAHTHTHTHTHTANRGSAVVAGLASGAQKRWNRRFPRLSFCQVSSRCCHQSTVDQSSPAKTGGWRKDFGHLVPGAYCHVRKSGGSLHETHLSKRANFIAATVHVKPVLCICAARLSGKMRSGIMLQQLDVNSRQAGRAMVKAASTSAHQNTRSRSRVLNLSKRQEGRGDGRGHSNVSVAADPMRVCTCAE